MARDSGGDSGGRAERRPRGKRRSIGVTLGVALLSSLALLAVIAMMVGAALVFSGRGVEAPRWMTMRVAGLANDAIPSGRVSVGAIRFSIDDQTRPKVMLQGVELDDPDGRERLALPDVVAVLDRSALLRGRVEPVELSVSGTRLSLGRDANGLVDLGFAGLMTAGTPPGTIAELLDRIRAVLDQPGLSAVRKVRLETLAVDYTDRRIGRTWTIEDGRMEFAKDAAGLRFEARAPLRNDAGSAASLLLRLTAAAQGSKATFEARFQDVPAADIADQAEALSWLSVLDAPISGRLEAALGEDGRAGRLAGSLSVAPGRLSPAQTVDPIPFREGRIEFTFRPEDARMVFSEVSFASDELSLKASGRAYLGDLMRSEGRALVGQVRLSKLRVNPRDFFVAPVEFDRGAVDFRLRLDPFGIDIGQLAVEKDEARLLADGKIDATDAGWRLALDARADTLGLEDLLALWPEAFKAGSRRWLARNVLAGRISKANAAIRARQGQRPRLSVTANFQDARVTYMKSMPPIEGGRGYVDIGRDAMTVYMSQGRLEDTGAGPADLAGSSFRIPDMRVKPAQAEIEVVARGALRTGLELLDRPPMRFLSRAGRATDLAQGRAEAVLRLGFELQPKVDPGDIDFSVEGRLSEITSTKLVPGRRLAAEVMAVRADNGGIRIGGEGTLDGVPFDATWQQRLGPAFQGRSRVEGQVKLSAQTAEVFGVALPQGLLDGSGSGRFELELARGEPPHLVLSSDLRGIGLRLPALGWHKAPGTAGVLELDVMLKPVPEVERLALSAAGLEMEGQISLAPDRSLALARFGRVRLNDMLDAAVDLRGQGRGRPPAIVVRSGSFDLRRFEQPPGGKAGSNAAGRPSPNLSVTLDRLVVTDSVTINPFRGEFTTARGLEGGFRGRINGQAAIEGTMVATAGGSALRLRSQDAGAVLRSAGMFGNARGGVMELLLNPTGAKGTYDGTLSVGDIRVVKTPALASLLSAISVVGLLEQLGGEGIYFSDTQAAFRLNPGAVLIKRGSAVGPSMGISVEGVYDLNSRGIDMQGVISPIYILNGLGQILTRNREGLFGFSYSLGGTATEPRPSVNPLSILAPGFFRDIFRKPRPELAE